MNGQIFQLLIIALNGNALQQGHSIDNFWPDSSAFQFEHETPFFMPKRSWLKKSWEKVADNPKEWLEAGHEDNLGYRIHVVGQNAPEISDRESAGFVGGGSRWLIEQVHHDTSSLWTSALKLTYPKASDNRIWTTSYFCVEPNWPAPAATINITQAGLKFRAALGEITAFAKSIESSFAENFAAAIAELDSKAPLQLGWSRDEIPLGLEVSLEARQLFAAASRSWVFGGMGSWNDMYLADPEARKEYDRISENLFEAIQQALMSAVNSTCSASR